MALKVYYSVGVYLCRLAVPNASVERAGFDIAPGQVFPQGVLIAQTLVGNVVCDIGGRT